MTSSARCVPTNITVMTSTATGAYGLDSAAATFFRARAFKFVHRNNIVVGRFGRSGRIEGTMNDRLLVATWNDDARRGWLTLAFAPSFFSFRGDYGEYEARHSVRGRKRGRADRT